MEKQYSLKTEMEQREKFEQDLLKTINLLLEQPSVYVVPNEPITGHHESKQSYLPSYDYVIYSYSVMKNDKVIFTSRQWHRTTEQSRYSNNDIWSLVDDTDRELDITPDFAKKLYQEISNKFEQSGILPSLAKEVIFLNKLNNMIQRS